ncbi:single-stranded-DNA-specific exonuclease RecJ [Solemya elarraichensis gill symbiont]|uniref:Single-stranded-DNA-specific exonuclease RecJ n=1 Tax=Solemya elarraichensis gill symbiont TaxID=1918949 RepID=A0A1T2L0E9_9GAMM|nr:single-stranded-DNA-specific exonuclease RecJ [Solemya elarraichensis gill symbiont]OOZ38587.1 single-stranded-DNA-specific exonuclease RecJ [Solemya elarraichensis gill symbiont]
MNGCEIIRRQATATAEFSGDLHPLLARVFANRGISCSEELELELSGLIPVSSLGQVDAAARLLEQALDSGWNILVIGDFDADGATSTAVAVSLLRKLGANVDYLVPNRFAFGYGLTPGIVGVALESSPDLIITVDNGISSNEGVAAAKAAGVHVLVTDHHLPGDKLPDADVIVNPNSPGESFPDKSLAGVAVIFYVMTAFVKHLADAGWFERSAIEQPRMGDWLDLVALGTVADVVPLTRNNRIIVEQGLRRMRAGKTRPGIEALCRVSKRIPAQLVSSDLGFALGPRLNAAGRLEDMSVGIECLLATDSLKAGELAGQLDDLNRQRREIEGEMKQQAQEMLDKLQLDAASDNMPVALTLYQEQWHQGVIGILASRIKEQWHRPVIAFASDGEGNLKGSARSITGLHIRDVLDAVSKQVPGLIEKFGGHAMAAGLTLPQKNFERFSELFKEQVAAVIDDTTLQNHHYSDGSIPSEWLDVGVAQQLKFASPWGQQFPEPGFDDEFIVVSQRVVGDNHLKLVLAPQDANGGC